jgi:hypothetical protein
MDIKSVDYKGYMIYPMPIQGSEAMWYGGYEITKNGLPIRRRKKIFPGFLYQDAAWNDSIEHAKIEIDNLRATH